MVSRANGDGGGVRIERASAALGAYIYDVDLSGPLDDGAFGLISHALRDHQMICFRDQDITVEQQIAFTRRFGEILIDDRVLVLDRYMKDHPGVMLAGGATVDVQLWHIDDSYSRCPLSVAIMAAKEISEFGDDQQFSNQHTAYDLLSDGMKRLLDPLRAVHRVAFKNGETEEHVHPVIRIHPATGRKCLFVNSQYTCRFDGMTEAESQPLLAFLYQHCSQQFLTHRHCWKPGDVLIWDNINTQHLVVSSPLGRQPRWWHRTSVAGTAPA